MEGTAKQIARYTALGALFLIPLTPLIVANSFFFPFITGKAFYFRILSEIAVAAWIVLAFLDRRYRPRFSWAGAAVVAFVLWMFIADAFAPNAAKAFWSNFERMEGWVLLIHLLGFFFAGSAVLRVEQKWRAWFLASLAVAVIVSVYAILQVLGGASIHQGSTRIDASLGNSAYLAIYLLFTACVAAWLALTEKQVWLKWSLLGLTVLSVILIFFTETRGTIVGLALAAMVAAVLALLTGSGRVRRWSAGALVVIVLLAGGLYLVRDSGFVQSSTALERIASISLSDGQVRFTLWRMALEGVRERPLVGWGQEGFNYIFNKFYDPSLYAQEQWFDRAHSAFVDWLTAGGIPAFFLYLALFGAGFYLLWTNRELSRAERIAVTAALVGYAVHNVFVFDNIYSYVYFFALLALIDSQTARPVSVLERAPEVLAADGMVYLVPVSAAALVVVFWFVNMPGIRVGTGLISALSSRNAATTLAKFEELTAHPSFATQEVREQTVNVAGQLAQSSVVADADKVRAISLAIAEMKKQVAAYPLDARGYLQLSYAYRMGGDTAHALEAVQHALALSPKKESLWIERGILEWDSGEVEAARAAFDTAYKLGPTFGDLADYAAAGAIAVGDRASARKILLDAHGTTLVNSTPLGIAYLRTKDWASLIDLWKLRTARPEANAQTWFSLAQAYYFSGDSAEAVRTIRTAIELFPSPDVIASGNSVIAQIQGKAGGQ